MTSLLKGVDVKDPSFYNKKTAFEKKVHCGHLNNKEFIQKYYRASSSGNGGLSDSGVSIFDPVLCELSYLWYTKEGDAVLDPFAGGSVRGVVAERLCRKYTGVDIRREQVEANIEQANKLCDTSPVWICGDSVKLDELIVDDGGFDFLFTCPPYADLEVYSDNPLDLSTMEIDDFLDSYEKILKKAVSKLKDDRFAVIVIGDARGKDGFYYNLPGKTIEIMSRAGAKYYNEAILVTPVGSLPIRVGRQFNKSRKLGKTHQNVLTFCKGDWRKAAKRLGDVVVTDTLEQPNDV